MPSQIKTLLRLRRKEEREVRLLYQMNEVRFLDEYFRGFPPRGFLLSQSEENPEVYITTLFHRRMRGNPVYRKISERPENVDVRELLGISDRMKELDAQLVETILEITAADRKEAGGSLDA